MARQIKKRHHYFMLHGAALFAISVLSLGVFMMVHIFAANIEDTVTVLDLECDPVWSTDNEEVDGILAAQCGDVQLELSPSQEASYLHKTLTNTAPPAIMCIKTETEYTKSIRWKCEIGKDEERPEAFNNAI